MQALYTPIPNGGGEQAGPFSYRHENEMTRIMSIDCNESVKNDHLLRSLDDQFEMRRS